MTTASGQGGSKSNSTRKAPSPSVRKMVRLSDRYAGPVDENGAPPESVIQEISQKTGEHPKTVRITFEVRDERKLNRKREWATGGGGVRWTDEERRVIHAHVQDQGGTKAWVRCAMAVNSLPANLARGAIRTAKDVRECYKRTAKEA